MSNLESFDTIKRLDSDVEAVNPSTDKPVRNRSVTYTDFTPSYDYDEALEAETEIKEQEQEGTTTPVAVTEFHHLQQGVLGVFYQNEHFAKSNSEQFEEIKKLLNEESLKLNAMTFKLDLIEEDLKALNLNIHVRKQYYKKGNNQKF